MGKLKLLDSVTVKPPAMLSQWKVPWTITHIQGSLNSCARILWNKYTNILVCTLQCTLL